MILLHSNEVELSRTLLASMPEGCTVTEGPGDYPVSAFPSVVVDVPAYAEDHPLFSAEGEFLGMERVNVSAHEELLRKPGSWSAVDSFISFVENRALNNPPT